MVAFLEVVLDPAAGEEGPQRWEVLGDLHCSPRQEGRCPGGSQALESMQLNPPRYPHRCRKWAPPHCSPTTSGVERPAHQRRPAAASGFWGAGPAVPPVGGHVQPGEQKGVGLSPAGRRVHPGGENPGAAVGHQHSPAITRPSSTCRAHQRPAESPGLLLLSLLSDQLQMDESLSITFEQGPLPPLSS